MKNVGDFQKRNEEYCKKFTREKIIANAIQSDNPVLFDIGAHFGESVEYLRSIFPNSLIYSFEPDPVSFDVLKNKKYSNNPCFNMAVSRQTGKMAFYQNEISHTNSLLKINLNSKDSIRISEELSKKSSSYYDKINNEVEVEVITLDDFIIDNDIESIDLLKIDVQGGEIQVLEGASIALGKAKAVILEAAFYDFYEKRTTFYDIENVLLPFGFSMFNILELSQNPMNGRTDWVEVLYTKQS